MIPFGSHDLPPGALPEVVTYLEMRTRPDLRATELPEGVVFRAIEPDAAKYQSLFRRVGALDWLWSSRLKLNNQDLTAIITDPDIEIFTLTQNGEDLALLELDFRQSGECELAFFGVAPELMGTGSGRYLMNRAIEIAWARPIERFHVHTCTIDSPRALPFYIRSGFVPYKRKIEVNKDPRLAGHLPLSAGAHMPLIKP